MKRLLLLALALVTTCTIAFANLQSPYSKGLFYAIKTVEYSIESNDDALDDLDISFEKYLKELDTDEKLDDFLDGFRKGIYQSCEKYGIDRESAAEIYDTFLETLAEMFSDSETDNTPNNAYIKGKEYATKCIEYGLDENNEAIERLDVEFTKYIEETLSTEDEYRSFFEGFKDGIYETCKKHGYSEDDAQYLYEIFIETLAEHYLE